LLFSERNIQSMSGIQHVFIVGVTGHLGQVIASQLVNEKFQVTAIVRHGHGEKHKDLLHKTGVKHVEAEGQEELTAKLKGADAVISTVSGDDKSFITYQSQLLAAAKANNVKLFIPSEFGSDIEALSNPGYFGYKAGFEAELNKSGVPYTLVQSGAFYEFGLSPNFHFDAAKGKVEILGDGNTPFRRTAMKDIAKAVCIILKHPSPPKRAYIASEVMTERQAVAVFEDVFGKKFEVVSKSKEQWQQESDQATVFFPNKFSAWLHGLVDVASCHEVNIQIPGSQSIREYAHHLKSQQK